MELRMHPRTEAPQRCLSFEVSVDSRARIHAYRDYLGNSIDHFNVPAKHAQLCIKPSPALDALIRQFRVERRGGPAEPGS